ncbi:hypothetical protein OSB04_001927 [Centaurea solstitialis]|uniref:Uncharacterized protein n=1 Tax=Centaurea solstitialis TaxID=347529 RepID=A0AA38U2H4_9ASTR|nr:hypothetical protein OSB04_001927 [Centaurea solstitialis]
MVAKDEGGVGVLCLKSMNIALLSKWSWKFEVGSNSLWKDFMAEFFGNLDFSKIFGGVLERQMGRLWYTIKILLKKLTKRFLSKKDGCYRMVFGKGIGTGIQTSVIEL